MSVQGKLERGGREGGEGGEGRGGKEWVGRGEGRRE